MGLLLYTVGLLLSQVNRASLFWICNNNNNNNIGNESAFLFQRLFILIQRYNAVAVLGTFTHTTPEDEM